MRARYVLLGGDVGNSPTPRMMNAAFESAGVDAAYDAVSVGIEKFGEAFTKLKEGGGEGANVTIPHKAAVVGLLDALDETPARIGAVNTVKKEGTSYRGYNTDVVGITGSLGGRGITEVGSACVIGTGGAARAFCEAMHRLGCRKLAVVSRDPARARDFGITLGRVFPEIEFGPATAGGGLPFRPELVFNASPAGAKGIPLHEGTASILERRPTVFDAVYFPVETGLVRLAKESGCEVIFGHEMLLHQGAEAFRIWTGLDPPRRVMEGVLLRSLGVAPR